MSYYERAKPFRPPQNGAPYATTADTGREMDKWGIGKKRFAAGAPLDLNHCDGPPGAPVRHHPAQGVCTTRFKKGFERRNVKEINPMAERKAKEAIKEQRGGAAALRRREYLSDVSDYNGFNVISGRYDPAKIRQRRHQARYLSDRPSAELLKSGEITIRNSHYRFYTALPSGDTHDRRQHQLVSEGLLKPKQSSVLGIGRADADSYGVEDQFSHSRYQKRGACEGLVETTKPGRYTPRKMGAAEAKGMRPVLFAGTWREESC